jgi:hypothetical protein
MKKIVSLLVLFCCAGCVSVTKNIQSNPPQTECHARREHKKGTIQEEFDFDTHTKNTRIILGKINSDNFGGISNMLSGAFQKVQMQDMPDEYYVQFSINAESYLDDSDINNTSKVIFSLNNASQTFYPKQVKTKRILGSSYFASRIQRFKVGPFTERAVYDMINQKTVPFTIYASKAIIQGVLNETHFLEMRKLLTQ